MNELALIAPGSFSGGPLLGQQLVRITYLDEAGVSNQHEEPYLVVAGIIIEPDRSYTRVEAYLRELREQYFPDGEGLPDEALAYGRPFIFHAKDVWHGSGAFPREKWPLQKRMKIFNDLSKIPRDFNLPIVWGAIDRNKHWESENFKTRRDADKRAHGLAFFLAARRVDQWMREQAPTEFTLLFAEDRAEVKQYIDTAHAIYTDRETYTWDHSDAFHSLHIIEPVSFVRKAQSPILQIADHCAFIIKRKLQGCKYVRPYYSNIRPKLWSDMSPGDGLEVRVPLAHLRQKDESD